MHLVIRVACMAQNAIRPGRLITWKCFLVFFFFCNAVWKDCSCCLMQGCLNMLQNSILSLLWSVALKSYQIRRHFAVFWEPLFRGDVRPFQNKTLLLPTFKKIKASVSANNLPTVSLFGISFGHRVKTGLSFPSFRGPPLCPYVRVLKTLWLSLCKQREKGEVEEGEYEYTGQPGQKQVQTTERRKRKGDKAKWGKRNAF